MCGRYRLTRADRLASRFGLPEGGAIAVRYNIAPTQSVTVIKAEEDAPLRAAHMRWGLIPAWAKDPSIGAQLINARAETISEKPSFRDALQRRRCLIPADGFYEWRRDGGKPRPFCFTMTDESVFAFAGLWERWTAADGRVLETCSIVTTTANDLLRDVHDRMPVILPDEAHELWADPVVTDIEALRFFLKPFNPKLMRRFEVSTRVNNVSNDDAECCAPPEQPVPQQSSLF
jgi:putative SOS response-associated peptidase YedK